MMVDSVISADNERAVESAVRDLVRSSRINGIYYVNLPFLYPDGSFVTVRIDQAPGGIRVSDAGFAFREVDDLDAARSFSRTAKKIAEQTDVCVGDHIIYVEAPVKDAHRAIIDVATASWRVADQICRKIFEEDDGELSEDLSEKLIKLFGEPNVATDQPILGASNNEWEMSAVVSFKDHRTVFQAVTNANSVYRTSTAFRDLADLENPPKLVAVVRSMDELGTRKSLLAPGRVIEADQSDDLFRKAAA